MTSTVTIQPALAASPTAPSINHPSRSHRTAALLAGAGIVLAAAAGTAVYVISSNDSTSAPAPVLPATSSTDPWSYGSGTGAVLGHGTAVVHQPSVPTRNPGSATGALVGRGSTVVN